MSRTAEFPCTCKKCLESRAVAWLEVARLRFEEYRSDRHNGDYAHEGDER